MDENIQIANDIGYPVIIKAAAGGGGRAMHVVNNGAYLKQIIDQTRNQNITNIDADHKQVQLSQIKASTCLPRCFGFS